MHLWHHYSEYTIIDAISPFLHRCKSMVGSKAMRSTAVYRQTAVTADLENETLSLFAVFTVNILLLLD